MATVTKQQEKEGIEKILAERLFENRETEEITFDQNIDSSKFEEANMPYVILTKKMIRDLFSDETLLILYNKKNDPKKTLKALVTADNYLENNTNPALKEIIMDAAEEGNTQKILDLITAKNNGVLSDAAAEEYFMKRMPQLISQEKQETDLIGIKSEKLEGRLGRGVRLTFDSSLFEHREIDKKYILRIKKTEDKHFKTVIHIDDIKQDTYFEGFKRLLGAANSVFQTDMKMSIDRFVEDACIEKELYKDGDEIKIYGKNYVTLRDDWKNVAVTYNKGNNFYSKNGAIKIPHIGYNIDYTNFFVNGIFGTIGALITLGVGIFGHNWTCFPYFAASSALGLSPFYLKKFTGGQYWASALGFKNSDKKCLDEYLKTTKSIDSFIKEHNKYYSSLERIKNIEELNSLRESRIKKLNKLTTTFESLKDAKGFSLVFESESLEGAYEKAYQVIELLKK